VVEKNRLGTVHQLDEPFGPFALWKMWKYVLAGYVVRWCGYQIHLAAAPDKQVSVSNAGVQFELIIV
jgi:hypothetical protein